MNNVLDYTIIIEVMIAILLMMSYYRYKQLCITVIVYFLQLSFFMHHLKEQLGGGWTKKENPSQQYVLNITGLMNFIIQVIAITLVNESYKFTHVFIQVVIFSLITFMVQADKSVEERSRASFELAIILIGSCLLVYSVFSLIHQHYISLLMRTIMNLKEIEESQMQYKERWRIF